MREIMVVSELVGSIRKSGDMDSESSGPKDPASSSSSSSLVSVLCRDQQIKIF
jgi:hypothetical protein